MAQNPLIACKNSMRCFWIVRLLRRSYKNTRKEESGGLLNRLMHTWIQIAVFPLLILVESPATTTENCN